MNTPMFADNPNEITLLYDSDGYLIVIIGSKLGNVQHYDYMALLMRLHGVKRVSKVVQHTYCADCSVYALQGTKPLAISKAEVRSYTEAFLANLAPEPSQPSLF